MRGSGFAVRKMEVDFETGDIRVLVEDKDGKNWRVKNFESVSPVLPVGRLFKGVTKWPLVEDKPRARTRKPEK